MFESPGVAHVTNVFNSSWINLTWHLHETMIMFYRNLIFIPTRAWFNLQAVKQNKTHKHESGNLSSKGLNSCWYFVNLYIMLVDLNK